MLQPSGHSSAEPRSQGVTGSRLRDLWRLTSALRRRLAAALALAAVGAVLSLAQPVVVNRIIAALTEGSGPAPSLVGLLITLILLGAVVSGASTLVLSVMAEQGTFAVRRDYVSAALRMPMWWYPRHPVGDLVARVSSDVNTLKYALSSGFVDIVGNSLMVVGAATALLVLDPVLTGVVCGLLLVSVGVVVVASPRIRRANRRAQDAVGQLGTELQQAVVAMRIVRPYGMTARATSRAQGAAADAYRHGVSAARIESVIAPVSALISQGSLVAIFLVGGWRVSSADLSLADLLTFALFLTMLVTPATSVIGAVLGLQEALGALDRIREVTAGPQEPLDASPNAPAGAGPVGLRLTDVTYRYPDGTADALRGVSLDVAPGERIALIGASGAGKSTIFSLLLGYGTGHGGSIRVGDVDLRAGHETQVRRHIAHVDQATHVFPGSIRENVVAGRAGVCEDDVLRALNQVGLAPLLARLPDGLASQVGEGGALLSGGERQRLAIARALISGRPVLLLDEPSSSLDVESERLVADAIETIPRDITVVTIAHRYSTIRAVDRVVVLDNGRVVEVGTPAVVAATAPAYRSLIVEA